MPILSKSYRSLAIATGIGCLVALGGCANTYSATERTASGVGVTATIREGVVIGVQPVTIRPDRNYLGAATGAILGGIAGSNVGGGDDERAARLPLPHERGVARMHPGRERLGEQRVAVLPDGEQAEARGRCVDGRSRTDDRDRLVVDAPQEAAVALRVLLPGVELDDALDADRGLEREPQLALLAVVAPVVRRRRRVR